MGKALPVFAIVLLAGFAPARGVVITVQTLLDSDVSEGLCSLREAIVAANSNAAYRDCPAGSGTDRIEFAVAGTIALGSDLPAITESLNVVGPAGAELVLDGGDAFRPILGTGGGGFALRIADLTLRHGHTADDGGCIAIQSASDLLDLRRLRFEGCSADSDGGAIDAHGVTQTTIRESTFDGNTAGATGGGVRCWSTGALTIEDSTFFDNQAGLVNNFGSAGAISVSFVDLLLRRSTVSGNSARGSGGGLAISGTATSIVDSSTIVGNSAGTSMTTGSGGGVVVSGVTVVAFANSVIAGNFDLAGNTGFVDDLYIQPVGPPVVTSSGFNFIGNNLTADAVFPLPGVPGQANVSGDFVGDAAAPLDPLLGSLIDRGGLTWTREPLPPSPLIDQGSCAGATRDQRGYFRLETGLRIVDDPAVANFSAGCDIGAVELGATNAQGLLHAGDFESGDTAAWSSSQL